MLRSDVHCSSIECTSGLHFGKSSVHHLDMNLRFIYKFSVIFCIVQFSLIQQNFLSARNRLPFTGLDPIPKRTPGPINIVTKNVTTVFTKPFIYTGSISARLLLKNTGKSVELTTDQLLPPVIVTGGVFYNDIYISHKGVFFWYDNATMGDYSASTINGKQGTQLEVSGYYYKANYGSFENALNYHDGVAQSYSRVNVGVIPNPLFIPFQYHMQKIKKPGHSTPITFLPAFDWYNLYLPNIGYYAYPSSYTDENTGKQYYCSTAVVLDLFPFNFISHKQFQDTFGQLLDPSGKPLTNVAKQYSANGRPVQISQDAAATVDIEFVPASPLYFHGGLKEKWLVNQTGKSVEVLVDQPSTVGSVTGGVLYGDKYKFHKFRYYWHDNVTTNGHHALSTINGQGSAHVEVVVYFYNEKYGSFDNSLNYRDGLVAVSSRVNVGWVSNPVYVPFQEIFKKKIIRPGDSVSILSSFTYLWYSTYPFNTIYYSYPGGYTDERTGKVYYCTTQIVLQLVPYNFISYEQFKETFGSLEDCSRQRLINASPQYLRGSLPMKKSHGFILKNVLA